MIEHEEADEQPEIDQWVTIDDINVTTEIKTSPMAVKA